MTCFPPLLNHLSHTHHPFPFLFPFTIWSGLEFYSWARVYISFQNCFILSLSSVTTFRHHLQCIPLVGYRRTDSPFFGTKKKKHQREHAVLTIPPPRRLSHFAFISFSLAFIYRSWCRSPNPKGPLKTLEYYQPRDRSPSLTALSLCM